MIPAHRRQELELLLAIQEFLAHLNSKATPEGTYVLTELARQRRVNPDAARLIEMLGEDL